MFCSKCGKEIVTENKFCPYCGQQITQIQPAQETVADTEAIVPATSVQLENEAVPQPAEPVSPVYSQPYAPVTPVPAVKKSNKPLIIGLICGGAVILLVLIILVGSIVIGNVRKEKLERQLLRDWSRVESSGSTYYTLRLDFDGDEIDYIFDGSYLDDELASYDYEVISGNEIYIEDFRKTIKVEFNDDKSMMTFTPALTSTEDSENWFNFE